MKVLVVFFSRTGNTWRLAQQIAVAMNGEIDEITDRSDRRGILGYLRSGNDGWFRRRTTVFTFNGKTVHQVNTRHGTRH